MYSSVPITQQIPVYFRKFVRINTRDSAWKYVMFSAIVALFIGALCSGDEHGLHSDKGASVFISVSGCIWLGIFNTIQSVCKEHDIINSEYRQGMNLGAFMIAHFLWQCVLCLIQAGLMVGILLCFNFFKDVGGNEPFIFFMYFLLIFCSAILGLMVSCLVNTPTTAMTVMPFLLIVQLLLGGYPIELSDSTDAISYITFSRWGVRAVGSYAGAQYKTDIFDNTFANRELGFIMCIILALVFCVISYIALAIRNKKS